MNTCLRTDLPIKVYSSYFCVLNYHSTKSTVTEVMATDKQVRGFKKAAFTKLISKLNRLTAEDSKDDVKDLLVELSNAYNAFEEAHNIVCEHNTDFDDFMKDEQYFLDVGKQYTQCLNDIKPWLNGDGLAAAVQPPSCNHNLPTKHYFSDMLNPLLHAIRNNDIRIFSFWNSKENVSNKVIPKKKILICCE